MEQTLSMTVSTIGWTPLHLTLFIHYAVCADPLEMRSQTWDEYRNDLLIFDLLKENKSGFEATAKGMAWLHAICATPMPVMKWVVEAPPKERP